MKYIQIFISFKEQYLKLPQIYGYHSIAKMNKNYVKFSYWQQLSGDKTDILLFIKEYNFELTAWSMNYIHKTFKITSTPTQSIIVLFLHFQFSSSKISHKSQLRQSYNCLVTDIQFYLPTLQQMYKKETSVPLLVIEFFNVAVTLSFLLLFARRFCQLRPYSYTLRYKNYFPKLRILFVLSYVVLGVALLSYNLATGSYEIENWYEYLLQGGGGECINSIILLVQLGVLRYELNKEQPYTKYHLMLFVYLLILEATRLVFTLLDVISSQNDDANLIISSIITTDALVQLIYWLVKRQSLPQFINPIDVEIDDLSYHTRLIQSRNERSQKSNYRRDFKNFTYLIPNVGYENGKIKIILEKEVANKTSFDNRTTRSGERQKISDELGKNSPLLHETSQSFKKQDCLTVGYYTYEQIKKFYAICGRYSIKSRLKLDEKSISQMIQSLKGFLDQVFSLQNCYQYDILNFFGLPYGIIRQYQQGIDRYVEENSHVDKKMGIPIPSDLNASFFSIVCYKYLWVMDHYQFYFKATARNQPNIVSYPYKKYHDFQELYQNLKKLLKIVGKRVELPSFPKKLNQNDNQAAVVNLLHSLQLFFRKVCNDQNLMKIQQIQEIILEFLEMEPLMKIQPKFQPYFFNRLKVEAKSFTFDLRRYESVILWEFSLMKGKQVIKTLMKEYEQLQALDSQLIRYLKNSDIPKTFSIPVLQKRQKKQKMLMRIAHYLQQVSNIQNIQRCYAVVFFFDIYNSNRMIHNFKQRLKLVDSNTEILNSQRDSQGSESHLKSRRSGNMNGGESNRISQILSDLGNEALD